MEKQWSHLTAQEKQEQRFNRWLSPEGINFISIEAEKQYKQRVQRIIDAIRLKEPDRVPAVTPVGYIPARYAGYTIKETMYDINKIRVAWTKYFNDFDHDVLPSPVFCRCGQSLDMLQLKTLKWPGNGLPDDTDAQVVEQEILKDDEWDMFTSDTTDFSIRYSLPRSSKTAEPLSKLPPLKSLEFRKKGFAEFLDPEIQQAFRILSEEGRISEEWHASLIEIDKTGIEMGFPNFSGGLGGAAPLDSIGAGLRGTKGTVLDMFKQPEKLIDYMEAQLPSAIKHGVMSADISGIPTLFMPLHRGADSFMSEQQFLKFYWPYLKRLVEGYIAEGCVPILFAEGSYNTRLDIISDLPKGSAIWHFDQTDMIKAKEKLGKSACIMGNVPSSLLVTGTPDGVMNYCKNLIEKAGIDGGYILSYGATPNEAKIENINAMYDSVKKFGVYKR